MTTFAEMVSDVIALTARPDLQAETELAVRASTLKAHHSDFYSKDLVETGIQFDTAQHLQTLQYMQMFPDWRKVRYLRKVADDGVTVREFLELIAPEDSLDMYNVLRVDVAYFAGKNLHIRSSTAETKYLIGYFQHPVATKDGYDSWIANEYPFAIIYEAAATVFNTIGQQEKTGLYKQMTAELYRVLKINGISEVGY